MEKKLIECVPNYSEGRDLRKVEKIVDCFRAKQGVQLLDYQADGEQNRCVITAVGEPAALRDAVVESFEVAVKLINLNRHRGFHPRMGAVDVCPFIPGRNATLEDADALAKEVAAIVGERFQIPCFLYESSATRSNRRSLSDIREGEFEHMGEKLLDKENWTPDYGPDHVHPTAGVTALGARKPLLAYNIYLDTGDVDVALKIAGKIRGSNGGYRYIKATGLETYEKNRVQICIWVTDYTSTSIYQVFEAVKMEAKRFGVHVVNSEIIGMLPMQALVDCAEYYLQLKNFDPLQVIEKRMLAEMDEQE